MDIDKRGKLSNHQFLSMGELLYNPLRHRLKKALLMKSEEYIKNSSLNKDTKDESFEKATLVPQVNINSNKISPEPEEPSEVDQVPYIDFPLYCLYLGVFCPRAPYDLKVNCNAYLVAFTLFDADDDGYLSITDMEVSLKSLLAGNLNVNDIKEVVNHVFTENNKEKDEKITKEEFQKILWMTNFNLSLSLFFV